MKKLIPLLLIALMSSCEKTIKYEIPEYPSKFSIDSRMLTGERIRVFVGKSAYSLSSREPQVLSDASVRLFEDDQFLTSLQWINVSEDAGYFQTPLRPAAGSKYRIEVDHPDLDMAIGETRALSPTQITAWTIDTVDFEVSVSFQDVPNTTDYYAINVYVRNDNQDYPLFLGTKDPTVDFFFDFSDEIFGDGFKSGYTAYLKDETFEGGVKKVNFEEVLISDFIGGLPDAVVLEVIRITEDYYRHEQSKGAQYVGGDNPFAEPVQIYSNVENGYGIVTSGAPVKEVIDF